MLGIGPMADGTIPELQQRVIRGFGKWVKTNSDAIYGTRPYSRFEDRTNTGAKVRYTMKDGTLNAFIIGKIMGDVSFRNLRIKPSSHISVLGYGPIVTDAKGWFNLPKVFDGNGIVVQLKLSDVRWMKI